MLANHNSLFLKYDIDRHVITLINYYALRTLQIKDVYKHSFLTKGLYTNIIGKKMCCKI